MGCLPSKIKLYPNYPNPFNPETTITYDIPVKSYVHLDIYNVLGVLTKRLVSEIKDAGSYSVPWDGTDNSGMTVSSGVYFYKLTSGTNSQINKALLVK